MLKRLIKYEDFDGNKCEDEFYFHYKKTELTQLNFSKDGGIGTFLQKIVSERNGKELYKFYEDFILGAIGERRNEGKNFVKTEEIRENFKTSNAYEVLFDEMANDPTKFAEFFNGVIPADMKLSDNDMSKAVAEAKAKAGVN